jgi:UDP-N-acetyl-2-amino-2-deoxyglucuronate dehydrogenase
MHSSADVEVRAALPEKRYALIGAAGYIAPRHMEAMKRTGGLLQAAYDPADSVGSIDRYFPDARFFTEFERFAEYLDRARRGAEKVDCVSICSPNYLHRAHVAFSLRAGMDAICEKPLALEPQDIDDLAELEKVTERRVHTILQLRLHPSIIALRDRIGTGGAVHDVDLTYVTARGRWYYESWKGDDKRSGGIATNIGVHFFDMLSFVFGPPVRNVVHHRARDCAAGYLELERARVRWFLSINRRDMDGADGFALRSMAVQDFGLFDFSTGFEDLHTASYGEIIAGRGFPLAQARPAIEIVSLIRNAPPDIGSGRQHPHLARVLADAGRYDGDRPV